MSCDTIYFFFFQTTILEMMLKYVCHFCMKKISSLAVEILLVEKEFLTLADWRCKLIFFVLKLLQKIRDTPACANNLPTEAPHWCSSLPPLLFFSLVCWNVFLKGGFEDSHFVREWKLLVVTSLEMGQWLIVTPSPCQTDRAPDKWGEEEWLCRGHGGILFHTNTTAELTGPPITLL